MRGRVLVLAYVVGCLLVGVTCSTSPPVDPPPAADWRLECDPNGENGRDPGDCTLIVGADVPSLRMHWLYWDRGEHEGWEILVDQHGHQPSDMDGWGPYRQAQPDTGYAWKGPDTYAIGAFMDFAKGAEVEIEGPQLTCTNPPCGRAPRLVPWALTSGDTVNGPGIELKWWSQEFAFHWADECGLQPELPECQNPPPNTDCEELPANVPQPPIFCAVSSSEVRPGLVSPDETVTLLRADGVACTTCHAPGAWQDPR